MSENVLEPKTSLPYWMFFVSGALISGYSIFIIEKQLGENIKSMYLFFYIGLFIILIGLIKLIFSLISKKEKKFANKISGVDEINRIESSINRDYNNKILKINGTTGKIDTITRNPQNINQNQNINKYMYCYKCGTRTFADAFYCPKCGTRLR
ncbi:MAG: hypothetical protein AB7V77_04265 [Candidatus Woesearchaeota archaeon]